MNRLRFTNESMLDISTYLKSEFDKGETKVVFEVLNPDSLVGAYAGKTVPIENRTYIYRGYKTWTDLAELLFCRMLTPTRVDKDIVCLRFEKLDLEDSFHKSEGAQEKYGVDSPFFQIHKNEEPAFLLPYKHALENVKIGKRRRVLDLGVNSGDEFALVKAISAEEDYSNTEFVGIDYSASAIAFAQKRFPEDNVRFIEHDINKLDELELGRFDLIISIGTFQSPNIDFKPFFMSLVQNYLRLDGAIILGFPNCRWMGGEMIYGAKVPNYAYSEMGMLYSDVIYCKKYLQQKKFRVTLTGKDYVFLTATKIGS
jgi:SAM-dependent methyltransferase